MAPNPAEEIVPPRGRYNCRSSLSQVQIPLRKLYLPLAGTNSASNFFSSLSQVQIPLRKLFLPIIAGTTSTPPYRRIIYPSAEFVPVIGRNNFRSRICSCDREERKLYLSGLSQVQLPLNPKAGANSASEVVPPYHRYKSAEEIVPPYI